MPIIPPLVVNNELVSVFQAKSNLFNNSFALQCTPFEKNSCLSISQSYATQPKLSSINFKNKKDILKYIVKIYFNAIHMGY